jgi:hypothetical protein
VRARAEEGQIVASGRRLILEAQQTLGPLLHGITQRIKTMPRDVRDMQPAEVVKLLREVTRLQSDLTSASKTNMEMERLLLGAGGDSEGKIGRTMSQQQAAQVIAMTHRHVERMKSRGELIDGEGEETERAVIPANATPGEDEEVFDVDAVDEEDDGEEADLPGGDNDHYDAAH